MAASRWQTEAEAIVDRLASVMSGLLTRQPPPFGPGTMRTLSMLYGAYTSPEGRSKAVASFIAKLETGWKPKKGPHDGYYTKATLGKDETMEEITKVLLQRFLQEQRGGS